MLFDIVGVLAGIAVLLAAIVTGARASDPLWLLKRPQLLARSLITVLITVPVISLLLVEVLSPGNVQVRAGVVAAILAVGMGAPDLLKRTDAPRDVACYVIGLNVVLMPLLVIYVPIAVAIHRAVFHHDVSLPWFIVAKVVLAQASLPFFVGLALARWRPNVADPIARHAPRFVGNTMLVVGVVAIFATWRSLLSFGAGVWLTCLTVATVAVLTGHLVGGPTLANKAVLAGFSAVRFPALALLILSVVPRGQRLIPLVIAYTISSAVVVSIYRAVVRKKLERLTGPEREHALRSPPETGARRPIAARRRGGGPEV